MRIPVLVIAGQIAYGATVEEVLIEYPDLEREDIQQALAYTAWLAHEEVPHSRGCGKLVEPELIYQRGLPPQATYLFSSTEPNLKNQELSAILQFK